MPPLDGGDIHEMIASSTVEDYDTAKIVCVPGWQKLSEANRNAVCNTLMTEQTNPTLPSKALQAALESLTPPPDDEEMLTMDTKREEEARRYLDEVGCPPCYPFGYTPPFHNVPERYRNIVGYWQSRPTPGVLPAQARDRKGFRRTQLATRSTLQEDTFSSFLEQVRNRRQRHGLNGDVTLDLRLEKQTELENWVEFQDYHLKVHEALASDVQADEKKSGAARELQDTERANIFEVRVQIGKEDMRKHEVLLDWIEQYRVEMMERLGKVRSLRQRKLQSLGHICNHANPAEAQKGSRDTSIRRCRAKQTGPAVRGKARITKTKQSSRNTRIQKREAPEAKPHLQNLSLHLQNSTSQKPKHLEKRRGHSKIDRLLSQTNQQKLSQASRLSDAGVMSPGSRRRRGETQLSERTCRLTRQRAQSAPTYTTRSGRISKPPAR